MLLYKDLQLLANARCSCLIVLSDCSISGSAESADQPQNLVGQPDLPPGLSPNKSHPTELQGRASASSAAPSNAAASDAVASAADSLQNSGASGPPTSQDTEKQLRNLRKKIRQADATEKKAAAGHNLTAEEQEKLQKLATWYALIFAVTLTAMLHSCPVVQPACVCLCGSC